jgi:hypothetical protein
MAARRGRIRPIRDGGCSSLSDTLLLGQWVLAAVARLERALHFKRQ